MKRFQPAAISLALPQTGFRSYRKVGYAINSPGGLVPKLAQNSSRMYGRYTTKNRNEKYQENVIVSSPLTRQAVINNRTSNEKVDRSV